LRPLAVAACCALGACAGAETAAPDADARAQELRVTTLADATCTLHPPGDEATALHLGSNHAGRVKFHARRVEAATQPAVLQLDCRDARGARDSQRLDLDTMLADGPSDEARAEALRIRPALSGDLEHISQRDLERGGYPRRPDAPRDSDAYRNWADAVSMPMRVLAWDGGRSELDFEDHRPSSNWCGAVATSGPYEWAGGRYVEPFIGSSELSQVQQIGAVWVGVGGAGDDTLIQAGTRQDYVEFAGIESTQHQVFRQVYPQTDAHYCSDCTINQGDNVQFSAQIKDADGNGGGTGTLFYWNLTQGEMASVDIAVDGGFNGGSAEWVVEDPRQFGNGLPEFGTLVWSSMQTYNANTQFIAFGASDYDTYDLVVDSHSYCTSQVQDDSSIAITRQPD
jgi:hypothetical protein